MYAWGPPGCSVGSMKVWAQSQENAFQSASIFLHRFCCIWTGRFGRGISFLCFLAEYALNATILQIGVFPRPKCTLLLADAAAIKVRLFYLDFSHMPSTTVCRRLLPTAPDFQSHYTDMEHYLFLDQTSWLQKGRNGKSTERLPHQHFQRYALDTIHRLYLMGLVEK